VFLRRRRYGRARIAAAAQVTFILWGWVLSQYPFVIPNGVTIDDAASPRRTLELLLAGLAIGFAILIPALRYLFRLFDLKGRATG
jgi:cytochrome d ubiquinol oxidase subunit II